MNRIEVNVITGIKTVIQLTQAELDDIAAMALVVVDHPRARNYDIRKAIMALGPTKIGLVRTALSTADDDVVEYWKHNDAFNIADSEIVAIKTALSLSDAALQDLFNSANS